MKSELKYEILCATREKVPYIAGADLAFCLHKKKCGCQTPHAGSNPTNLEEHKRQVRPPQSGQVICVYTEGQKAGLTPYLGFDPAIGAHCVNVVYVKRWFCYIRALITRFHCINKIKNKKKYYYMTY